MGVSFAEAAHTYSLLTVGDGLVSQVPALVVSTAAGLLVAKAGVATRTDRALFGQLGAHPRALGTTSGLLAVLAIVPGLPMLPFLTLACASGALAWHLARREVAAMHRVEAWRERLLADGDPALAQLLDEHPTADRQHLRALVRSALDERRKNKPPRAFRELYRALRELIVGGASGDDDVEGADETLDDER